MSTVDTKNSDKYSVYGLTLGVNRSLPGLRPVDPNTEVDVVVDFFGEETTELDRSANSFQSGLKLVSQDNLSFYHFWFQGYGQINFNVSFWGTNISANWTGSNLAEVTTLLLGQIMGSTLRLRGHLCLHACVIKIGDRAVAIVGHVGIMLSRNAPALRVNIKRLQSDTLMPYLQEIGWQNETESLEVLALQLFPLVERITVCLDVGTKIYPKLGLECIFLNQPPQETRWEKLIEYLVAQKLCKPAKKETLLNWAGKTTPVNTKASWPSQLIIESLLKPTHLFTVFDRRLSHLKITWQPNHCLEAKAYLSFQHYWLSAKKINNEQ